MAVLVSAGRKLRASVTSDGPGLAPKGQHEAEHPTCAVSEDARHPPQTMCLHTVGFSPEHSPGGLRPVPSLGHDSVALPLPLSLKQSPAHVCAAGGRQPRIQRGPRGESAHGDGQQL